MIENQNKQRRIIRQPNHNKYMNETLKICGNHTYLTKI
jgi:hypothetical protein